MQCALAKNERLTKVGDFVNNTGHFDSWDQPTCKLTEAKGSVNIR